MQTGRDGRSTTNRQASRYALWWSGPGHSSIKYPMGFVGERCLTLVWLAVVVVAFLVLLR